MLGEPKLDTEENWGKRYAKAERPLVRVIWWDASQSSGEILNNEPLPESYNPGVLDEVVGFLCGETSKWLVLADSFESDSAVDSARRRFRSVRNIRKESVCAVIHLKPEGIHPVVARSAADPRQNPPRAAREGMSVKGKGVSGDDKAACAGRVAAKRLEKTKRP
jgi:hypothetical protein